MSPPDLPPLPWSILEIGPENRRWGGFVYLLDATGAKIGVIYGTPARKKAMSALIQKWVDVEYLGHPKRVALDDEPPTPA